ncbi:nuclear transport factor 2 family protein [Microlunatus ginsengisoli]|uniref:SnoaL-like domain-containing protein n=1 Tax=Microlunatus ginsengisoli TaxID=363863 RepID=A0ABP7ALL2_9ACTN
MDQIARLLTAMNAHDLEAAAALFHEDYRSEQPAHPGRSFIGRAQMHANWAAIFAGIPDFHAELLGSAEHGGTIWTEWLWTGNRRDGVPLETRGVTLFQVEGEFIVAGRLYMEDVETTRVGIEQVVEEISGERPKHAAGGA